mmetsp:Transcript_63594/g.150680  ORF Transcript_63594/g.150680 Transcript_63594/m.150680 type:complete len:224 (+) Transcript_63594:521-1192(+)
MIACHTTLITCVSLLGKRSCGFKSLRTHLTLRSRSSTTWTPLSQLWASVAVELAVSNVPDTVHRSDTTNVSKSSGQKAKSWWTTSAPLRTPHMSTRERRRAKSTTLSQHAICPRTAVSLRRLSAAFNCERRFPLPNPVWSQLSGLQKPVMHRMRKGERGCKSSKFELTKPKPVQRSPKIKCLRLCPWPCVLAPTIPGTRFPSTGHLARGPQSCTFASWSRSQG